MVLAFAQPLANLNTTNSGVNTTKEAKIHNK